MQKKLPGYAFILMMIGVALFVSNCKNDEEEEKLVPPPEIISFTPESGGEGTTVTIEGNNFSSIVEENQVTFNQVAGVITAATKTSLTTTVPLGASSGKIIVTVGEKSAVSSKDFQVLPSPTITSFSPASGYMPTEGVTGTTVIITGTNFSTTAVDNIVKFNGVNAAVSTSTSTQLTTIVPSGASTGKITVSVNGITATSTNDFTVNKSVTITSFTPASASPGHFITITGTGFSTVASQNVVSFNNSAEIPATSSTETTLNVVVPVGATSGKLTVKVNGIPALSTQDFTVLAPLITSFSPAYGLPGTTLTITGEHFGPTPNNNTVNINGTPATILTATETQITATIPSGATTGKITVTFAERTATSNDDVEVLKDIPRNGLIAFYPFTGNANDVSGSNANGTVSGAVLTADRFGKSNQSYSFDGLDDHIAIGNPAAVQTTTKVTVAGWVNINEFKSNQSLMAIITKIYFDPNAGGNPAKGYWLRQDFYGNGTPSFAVALYSATGTYSGMYVGGNEALTTGTWMFIAMTINDMQLKVYKNGTLTNDVTNSVNLVDGTQGDLMIGTYGGGFKFDGLIDDVTIYNRALSDNEVQQLYEQTVTKY
jgi:uncharacterized protein (TIGR03437 family)